MIRNSLLILLTPLLFSGNQQDSDPRTKYFPKTEVKVAALPVRKNVWVFILAGQSNMAGRGQVEASDTIPSERIFSINAKNEIILAKEPLHFYEPSLRGLDCGLAFGKELIKQVPDNVSILLIPTAVGGSSISQWLDDATHRDVKLFSNFLQKVKFAKEHGTIKGILWHQGESDANPANINLYQKRLSTLVQKFRQATGNKKLPVVMGELGSYSATNENWQAINKQITQYALTDKYTAVVKTSDLIHKGDQVHFNSEGQRIMGQRFAKEYIRILK